MHEGEPRNRRRAGLLLALAVVVVTAIAGVGVALNLSGGDDPAAEADALPSPPTITRGGATYRVGPTSPAAAALDPSDGRSVVLYATHIEQPEQPECASLEPRARIVEETDDVVRIATFDYTARQDVTEDLMCSYTTDSPGSEYRALRLRLSEPLGARRLVDDRSGDDIGHLEADFVPVPAYVPKGFDRSHDSHFTPQGSFLAMRQYHHRRQQSSLEVMVRSATAWQQTGKVLDRASVRGHEATVTEEDYQRCVSWTPRRGLVAEVCSLQEFLPSTELLRIADSVPPLP